MGIDVYIEWDDMTEEEEKARFTGFSVVHGHVGYLREAYHGGPYATGVLVPETFDPAPGTYEVGDHKVVITDDYKVFYPPEVLEGRLEATCAAAMQRSRAIYGEEVMPNDPVVQSFVEFVKLYRRLYDAGRNPCIYNSH